MRIATLFLVWCASVCQSKHRCRLPLCAPRPPRWAPVFGAGAGAAIIIGTSQVRYIVGYRVPRQDSWHEQIAELIKARAGFVWQVRHRGVQVGPHHIPTAGEGGREVDSDQSGLRVGWQGGLRHAASS
jgi:hypothetical protein